MYDQYQISIPYNSLPNYISSFEMDKDKIDKNSPLNIFDLQSIHRDFNYKISSADVLNECLYIGDDKGNIYYYPIVANDPEIIPKSAVQQTKNISKHKIDKLQCYHPLSCIYALSDQKLYVIDSALRKPQIIALKVHDFSINEAAKEGILHAVAVVSKKKEGYLIFLNPATKKFEESKKFSINELPANVGYTGIHIICSYKKQYQTYNVQKNFAMAKFPLQTKTPLFKVTGRHQIVFFVDDIGLFMDPQFQPLQKDNISLNTQRQLISIGLNGKYCLVLCEGSLYIYNIAEPKKCTFIQKINTSSNIRGITRNRPFIYGKDEVLFLHQIHYEIQIKQLIQRCRVQEALALLRQNVGEDNKQKIEELKLNAIWPLLRRLKFEKVKEIIKSVEFDIRELVLLYPELSSTLDIQSIKGIKPDKYINTLIIQYIEQKTNKIKDEESELKMKSKLFLKQVLQYKREQLLAKINYYKVKIQFNTSKYSLIKQKINPATPQELLEIIDYYLIRLLLDLQSFTALDNFFKDNHVVYCKRLFPQLQPLIKSNQNLISYPTLKPKFYAAFQKYDQAFEIWKFMAENSKQQALRNQAYEQIVKLLAQYQNKSEVLKNLNWVLTKKPEIGMSFFKMVDLNFINPDDVISNFESEKNNRLLQLYLQTIVLDKKTYIEEYHTKLLLVYLEAIFELNKKENKEALETQEFTERVQKMRTFLHNPEAKYAVLPILKRIEKCQWLFQEQIYLYSCEGRHEQALKKYINKSMTKEAEEYCMKNREGTLTIYFKLLLATYKSFEESKNNQSILWKKDIITFLKKYSSQPELDPIAVLQMIPDRWRITQCDGGIYHFLESAIIHTLHQSRAIQTAKHLSEFDLLNTQYKLVQAKRACLKFTYKKKCCICDTPISDIYFVVYPNANVCHQACVKNYKNTICPVTKQDFQKTFKY